MKNITFGELNTLQPEQIIYARDNSVFIPIKLLASYRDIDEHISCIEVYSYTTKENGSLIFYKGMFKDNTEIIEDILVIENEEDEAQLVLDILQYSQ